MNPHYRRGPIAEWLLEHLSLSACDWLKVVLLLGATFSNIAEFDYYI